MAFALLATVGATLDPRPARFARECAPFTYPDDVRLVIATTGQPYRSRADASQ